MSVVIETTLGDVTVDLYLDQRPVTCLNFLKLCKMKYYNFNLFHSIRSGFIAQTGDPTAEGSGGESIFGLLEGPEKRFFSGEKLPKIRHTNTGTLSMVCTGDMMVGSQFFFTLAPDLDSLDSVHCVIGEVTEGHDVLRKLNDVICDEGHRPYRDVRITHTVVLEDPFNDPSGLRAPSRSPSPSAERLKGGRIAPDEDIDETQGKSVEEIQELIAEKEAKARATILEIVGDLPDAEIAPPENVLFVCKLNPVTTDEDLEIIFSRFGKIVGCEVIRDKKSGDSLQYAFIEFADKKSCEDAYFKMDNVLIDDRRIHVDFSQSVSRMRWLGKGRGIKYFNNNESKDKNIHNDTSKPPESKDKDHKNGKLNEDDRKSHENRDREHHRDRRHEKSENDRYKRDRHRSRSKEKKRNEKPSRHTRERKRSHRERSSSRTKTDKSKDHSSRDRKDRSHSRSKLDKELPKNRKHRSKSRSKLSTSRDSKRNHREKSTSHKNQTEPAKNENKRSNSQLDSKRSKHDSSNNEKRRSKSNEKSHKSHNRNDSNNITDTKNPEIIEILSPGHERNDKPHSRKQKSNDIKKDNSNPIKNKKMSNKDLVHHKKTTNQEGRPDKKSVVQGPQTSTPEVHKKGVTKTNDRKKKVLNKNSKKKRKYLTSSSESSSDSSTSSDSSSSSEEDRKKKSLKRRKKKVSTSSSSSSTSSSDSSSSTDSTSSSSSSDSEPAEKKRKSKASSKIAKTKKAKKL